MNKDLTNKLIIPLMWIILAGLFGLLAGSFVASVFKFDSSTGMYGGGLFCSGIMLFNSHKKPDTKPRSFGEAVQRYKQESATTVFNAAELPQPIINQTTEVVTHVSQANGYQMGYFSSLEYDPDFLKQVAFYVYFWPGNISQNFLKQKAKIVSTDARVSEIQEKFLEAGIVQKKDKGRPGRVGVELTQKGKHIIKGLALSYSPTSADRMALKNSMKKWGT